MSDDASVGTLPTGLSVADPPRGEDPSTDRGAAIVGAALDSIVTFDERGRVVEFNPASEVLFGWTRDEAIGRELDELFIPAAQAGAHRDGILRYGTSGDGPVLNQRLELPAVRRDGTALVVELITVPMVHDGRREFTGFIRDVTELRRTQELLRESQARYEAIVRHSTKALVLCAPDGVGGTLLAGEWLLGLPSGTPLSRGLLSIVHPDDAPAAARLLAEVADGTRGPATGWTCGCVGRTAATSSATWSARTSPPCRRSPRCSSAPTT